MSIDKTSSGERLSFTVFLAIAVHAVIILGIAFSFNNNNKVAPNLNITLATHKTKNAPEEADFLAQHNQEASGTVEKSQELTTNETTDVVAPNINQIVPIPQRKSTVEAVTEQDFLTTKENQFQVTRVDQTDETQTQEELQAQQEDTLLLNPEIASLRAKLDKLQQQYARRPRIRRMTSVATKSSHDAEYLNRWTQKVESLGNQHFPQQAIENKLYGSLRMSVIINEDGSVETVEILKPSGYPILDQAALQVVRLASPFDPFPPEIKKSADQLDIIRTWRFEITGMSTDGNSE